MSAITIMVLRFWIFRKKNSEGLGLLKFIGLDNEVMINYTKSYLMHSNVHLVQTWLTRDQRHGSYF